MISQEQDIKMKMKNDRTVSVYIGGENIAAVVACNGIEGAYLVDASDLREAVRFYSKRITKYRDILLRCNQQPTSKKIQSLETKLNNKIDYAFGVISRWIVNYCVKNKVDRVVVGGNEFWKAGGISVVDLARKITYKARGIGIKVFADPLEKSNPKSKIAA